MNDYQTPARMALKRKAIPLPDLVGKTVLDVGCDHGYWCWLAYDLGASHVVGLDRNRDGIDLIVRNTREAQSNRAGCAFSEINVGKQWRYFGKFDVVFCFSMYHYIYEGCGDHLAAWYWLWRHAKEELLWENPISSADAVVRMNVTKPYNRDDILKAAETYFDVEKIGPALHMPLREVWRCKPRSLPQIRWIGQLTTGGGGASKAFAYSDNRRIKEIAAILGITPFPGTLNVKLDHPFGFERDYYRAELLETVDRANLNAEWKPRWARFYPVTVNGIDAHAIRFENEKYPTKYLELIAPERLRDKITSVVDVRS